MRGSSPTRAIMVLYWSDEFLFRPESNRDMFLFVYGLDII